MMIPTKQIKGWVDYEVQAGLFLVSKVDYDARGKSVDVTFENKQGDRIRNRYNLDHEFGEYAWNRFVTAATGISGDGGVGVDQLVNTFVLLDIEASEPNAEGRVFYNVKRTNHTDETFGAEPVEEFGGPTLELDVEDLPF